MAAQLKKAERVVGRNLALRNARESDAAFIFELRTDRHKAQHLSQTAPQIDAQTAWLQRYANDSSQAYFVIEDQAGLQVGTVRLYDARSDSFCWGSWIIRDGTPSSHAFESALMVYRYALALGFRASHFDVRRANQSVWRFHERFGAVRIGETSEDFLYTISHDAIAAALDRYSRFLPNGIRVEDSG